MGDLIKNEEFKTPSNKFIQELEVLENYNSKGINHSMARMSLFNQFDPLVAQSKSPQTPIGSSSDQHQYVNDIKTETIDQSNQSATLIHINSPTVNSGQQNQ